MSPSIVPEKSIFYKEKHIKYWLRCLKTYLPTAYTSNDSNRVTLACFIVSALDLLGVLEENTTSTERAGYVDWIYHCQHPGGGFRAFTGNIVGEEDEANRSWDPANIGATVFALTALLVLRDDLERVKRKECLEWVAGLQLEDGSFGEVLDGDGLTEGGQDVRFSLCPALIRWILRGDSPDAGGTAKDMDVDRLVDYVKSSRTYDGGIGKAPHHEAHGGMTYCGIGALTLLDKLPQENLDSGDDQQFLQETLEWLVSRQTAHIYYDSDEDDEDEGFRMAEPAAAPQLCHEQAASAFGSHGVSMAPPAPLQPSTEPLQIPEEMLWAGLNGRCNKPADTCYSFWVGASLNMLNKVYLMDFNANRRYLLDKTQHIIGGFAKMPGDPPDIMHSFFGLAGLAIMKEPGLKSLDPRLCISVSAREHLESLPWRKGISSNGAKKPDEHDNDGINVLTAGVSYMAMSGG